MHLPHTAVAVGHDPRTAAAAEQKQTWQVLSGIRRAPRRAVPRAWWVGLAALVLGVLVLYVHTVQTEAALNKTQQDIRAMKQQATAMRAQLANLQNPRQVEAKATQALQMEAPREVVYMKTPGKVEAPAVNRIPPAPAMPHEGF